MLTYIDDLIRKKYIKCMILMHEIAWYQGSHTRSIDVSEYIYIIMRVLYRDLIINVYK